MKKTVSYVLIGALLILAGACSKANQADRDRQAVRAALQKHLAERGNLNMAAMDMDVKQVTVSGNRADAQVEFRAKQGGPSMQMAYALERQGDAWVVRGGRPLGGEMSHPPTDGATPPAGAPLGPPPRLSELPAGHPPTPERGKAPAPPAKKQ